VGSYFQEAVSGGAAGSVCGWDLRIRGSGFGWVVDGFDGRLPPGSLIDSLKRIMGGA
jgi:hypothetical protein